MKKILLIIGFLIICISSCTTEKDPKIEEFQKNDNFRPWWQQSAE